MNRPAVCHFPFYLHVHKTPGKTLTNVFTSVSVHTEVCYPTLMTVYLCGRDGGGGDFPL